VQLEHDREADAVYVQISPSTKVEYTRQLDENRIVDYGADETVVGMEFLNVSAGVDLQGFPHHDEVSRLLSKNQNRHFA
jgi:uncharacterized protein YuzE